MPILLCVHPASMDGQQGTFKHNQDALPAEINVSCNMSHVASSDPGKKRGPHGDPFWGVEPRGTQPKGDQRLESTCWPSGHKASGFAWVAVTTVASKFCMAAFTSALS